MKRLASLKTREKYNQEVAEFFAEKLVEAELDGNQLFANRCRRELDTLDEESKFIEAEIYRLE